MNIKPCMSIDDDDRPICFCREVLYIIGEASLLVVASLFVRGVLEVLISLFLLPLLSVIGMYWDIITTTAAILLCAAYAGHRSPDRAVARSLVAIPILFGLDAVYFYTLDATYLVDWAQWEVSIIASILLGTMLMMALSVAVARRIKRDFRGYIRDHLDEFRESLEDYGLIRRVDTLVDGLTDQHHEAKRA